MLHSHLTRTDSERSGARSIKVWDPLVRLIHWGIAIAVLLNGAILDDEGDLHQWVGYTAVALVVIRLVWGVVGQRHARFSAFPPSPRRAIAHFRAIMRGDRTVHLSHNPIGALMVYNLWATLIVIAITGYMMTTTRFFGVDWVEEAHEIAFNWLMVSVVLHVAGVVFDTWRSRVPLFPAMIHGNKRIPENTEVQ